MKQTYAQYAESRAKKSPLFRNCIMAFCTGGLICSLAQGLLLVYSALPLREETAKLLVPVTLIFLTALVTGLNRFDSIAKHAGAGTLVPITGFANAVAAPAMDTRDEGWVLGLGAKIFTVAGPVILYGTLASAVYGVFLVLSGGAG